MSKMEELRFMADLNWKINRQGFDKIFDDKKFFEKFLEFMKTKTYQQWLTKKEGLQYIKWQAE